MEEKIKKMEIGESLVLDKNISESKRYIKNLNLVNKFAFVPLCEKTTTIVKQKESKSIQAKILSNYESGNVFVGCLIKGNHQSIQNSVVLVNKLIGSRISCKPSNDGSFLFEEILSKDSITLDEFKVISVAMEKKKEILSSRIVSEEVVIDSEEEVYSDIDAEKEDIDIINDEEII